jgi:hypothetical protein
MAQQNAEMASKTCNRAVVREDAKMAIDAITAAPPTVTGAALTL